MNLIVNMSQKLNVIFQKENIDFFSLFFPHVALLKIK